jgi:hypothetical protein
MQASMRIVPERERISRILFLPTGASRSGGGIVRRKSSHGAVAGNPRVALRKAFADLLKRAM